MAQIFVFGRVTADLTLKVSQTQNPYVCFDLAERIGYGNNQRTLFYQVWAWGPDAARIIRLGVKKDSMIWLTGSQDLVDCTVNEGKTKTKRLKVALDNCGFIPTGQSRHGGTDAPDNPEPIPCSNAFLPVKELDGDREALPE